MEIHIQNRQNSVKIKLNNLKKTLQNLTETRYFQGLLKKRLPFYDYSKLELSIVLVSEKSIRQMNKRFRGIDKVTDVLSFPMFDFNTSHNFLNTNMLGDVVVCPSKSISQAQEYNVDYEDELLRLIIHGILHLLGFDHETDSKEAQRMLRVQKRACDLMSGQKAGEIILGMPCTR